MSNVRADGSTCWWTTAEDRALRDLYPTAGLEATAAALPARTPHAIRQRAHTLGLKLRRKSRAGMPAVRWADTPELDAALKQQVPACKSVQQVKALAQTMGRPFYWLRRRCAQLGIDVPAGGAREWGREELALLAELAHKPAAEIQRAMRRAGYRRSAGAIALRLRRASMDRSDPDSHSTSDLAMLLGVQPQTVRAWITTGGLRATLRPTDRSAEGQHHRVHRRDLRTWLRDNPTKVDLAKVDGPWFIDLALGAVAT